MERHSETSYALFLHILSIQFVAILMQKWSLDTWINCTDLLCSELEDFALHCLCLILYIAVILMMMIIIN